MFYYELFEGRDALLYHTMDIYKAEMCFKNDEMPAKWEHKFLLTGKKIKGNSFSRNRNLIFNVPVGLVINQILLAQTHKIYAIDGQKTFFYTAYGDIDNYIKDRNTKDNNAILSEEFVIGDIKELHKYIERVEIFGKSVLFCESALKICNIAFEYCEKWNISLTIEKEIIKLVNDHLKNWDIGLYKTKKPVFLYNEYLKKNNEDKK